MQVFYSRKSNSLAIDDLNKGGKIVFAEVGLSKEFFGDSGMSFTSDAFRQFGRQMKIEQAINGHVKAHIIFVKCTINKCLVGVGFSFCLISNINNQTPSKLH